MVGTGLVESLAGPIKLKTVLVSLSPRWHIRPDSLARFPLTPSVDIRHLFCLRPPLGRLNSRRVRLEPALVIHAPGPAVRALLLRLCAVVVHSR